MAEPHSDPRKPAEEGAPPGSIPTSTPSAAPEAPPRGSPGEPSDEAPTIISKNAHASARPEDAFPLALRGRRLGHFELLEAIGVGGMAAVIRARDTQLDRSVALKILPPEMAVDPENVRRFQQEARAAAKLDHENIARVYFCGEDQGLHFIAFEFVEGENLRTVLDRVGRLSVRDAVHYLLQVATGLAHASARGVIHRDIKPSNIIIGANGRAKLVDMGLARSLEPGHDPGLTRSGVTLGTFDYISPEQALEPREADVRSDLYSLGCTFYHMLTGRPPVPDGTAAKKLHHHQHVAPIDPRQLSPDIPDEVAAVLARMMAKDPRHRYQRAEHLVQHLIQLGHKLGAVPEMPDGVLFVDTPLPAPPRLRTGLVSALATAVLVGLVFLHGLVPGPGPRPDREEREGVAPAAERREPKSEFHAPAPVASLPDASRPASGDPAASARTSFPVTSAKEFADLLRPDSPASEILLEGDLSLASRPGTPLSATELPGLVFQGEGRALTVQPKDEGTQRTIRLKYDPDVRADGSAETVFWTAFTVRAGHVTFRHVRFEINATQAQVRMAAVRVQNGGRVTLDSCEFVQVDPSRTDPASADPDGLSSVVVEEGQAEIRNCLFRTEDATAYGPGTAAANQNALILNGGSTAKLTSCAFGPHTVLFYLRRGGGHESRLEVSHCSALLKDETAFQLDDEATCRLAVQASLFSLPLPDAAAGATGALVRQAGDRAVLHFQGSANRYHNLSAFWVTASGSGTAPAASGWSDFQRRLQAQGGTDSGARVLDVNPWAEANPLRLLTDGRAKRAFQADLSVAELRTADPRVLVGVDHCSWGRTYDASPPPLAGRERAPAPKVVDPSATRLADGVYPSLALAMEDARPGEILIKHDGLLPVKPVRLEKATDDVTIKPFPGYHPVLTLGETRDPDAALFRLHDGRLRLEGLEFHLCPRTDEFTTQAVAEVIGEGRCLFTSCVATLEEPRGKPLALVLLTDPSRFMKMEPTARARPQTARVQLDRCFVRGEGELVTVRACRPLDLKVENSLVVLAGSFLTVEGNANDAAQTPPVSVRLTRVTAFLSDYLVRLRADKDGKEPVPVQINPAVQCLFASADGKALIHLDGLEITSEQMKHLFAWEGGRQNVYSRFQPMLDQQPRGDDMPLPPYDQQRWKTFTGETDGLFFNPAGVRFADPPGGDGPLAKALVHALPNQFRVKTEAGRASFGAEVEELPSPFSGSLPAAPSPTSP